MRKFIFITALLIAHLSFPQVSDSISLEYCHELAMINYPAAQRTELLSSASEIQQKKLNANYLPQVQINGQAHYQSDVPRVDVVVPSFYLPPPIDMQVTPSPLETPVPPKDQYRVTMDIFQVIYDGGLTSRQKSIDLTQYEMEKQRVEIELHKLKENINTVYFSIILMQENTKLLNVLLNNLNNKLADVEAAVENGVALTSDRDVLKAEVIRVEQQLQETAIQREAFIGILSELISEVIPFSIVLSMPEHMIAGSSYIPERPELMMYDLQKSVLEHSKELVTGTWRPKLSAFGQAGYGNPGLNVMEDKFTPYYMVGAKLNWNIWNWNQNKKDKQILGLRQDLVDRERETFDKNLKVALEQHLADIRKYEILILRDMEVIDLRKSIAQTAHSQFDNGVITSSDLVSRLNEEAQAKLNMEVHRVRLAKSKVDYLTTLGIL
jgi:outer membrane protein TolC